MTENINVLVRIRPSLPHEPYVPPLSSHRGDRTYLAMHDHEIIVDGRHYFAFDKVLDMDCTSDEVSAAVCDTLVRTFVDGVNASALTYGQTGAGKTYTMNALTHDVISRLFGALHLLAPTEALSTLSPDMSAVAAGRVGLDKESGPSQYASPSALASSLSTSSLLLSPAPVYVLLVSVLEVYQEQVYDLLAASLQHAGPPLRGSGSAHMNSVKPTGHHDNNNNNNNSSSSGSNNCNHVNSQSRLRLREDPTRGVYVCGLSEYRVQTADELHRLVRCATASRATAATTNNATSSRSHCVVTLTLHHRGTSSRLFLVDLAGSERLKKLTYASSFASLNSSSSCSMQAARSQTKGGANNSVLSAGCEGDVAGGGAAAAMHAPLRSGAMQSDDATNNHRATPEMVSGVSEEYMEMATMSQLGGVRSFSPTHAHAFPHNSSSNSSHLHSSCEAVHASGVGHISNPHNPQQHQQQQQQSMSPTQHAHPRTARSEFSPSYRDARLREGISVNSGLLALSNVIHALYAHKSHIPYRSSVLTRILQPSFAGHGRTVMLACISPHESDRVETMGTLKYAHRVKSLKTTPRVAVSTFASHEQAERTIVGLRLEMAELQRQLAALMTVCSLQQQQQQQQQQQHASCSRCVSTAISSSSGLLFPTVSPLASPLHAHPDDHSINNTDTNIANNGNVVYENMAGHVNHEKEGSLDVRLADSHVSLAPTTFDSSSSSVEHSRAAERRRVRAATHADLATLPPLLADCLNRTHAQQTTRMMLSQPAAPATHAMRDTCELEQLLEQERITTRRLEDELFQAEYTAMVELEKRRAFEARVRELEMRMSAAQTTGTPLQVGDTVHTCSNETREDRHNSALEHTSKEYGFPADDTINSNNNHSTNNNNNNDAITTINKTNKNNNTNNNSNDDNNNSISITGKDAVHQVENDAMLCGGSPLSREQSTAELVKAAALHTDPNAPATKREFARSPSRRMSWASARGPTAAASSPLRDTHSNSHISNHPSRFSRTSSHIYHRRNTTPNHHTFHTNTIHNKALKGIKPSQDTDRISSRHQVYLTRASHSSRCVTITTTQTSAPTGDTSPHSQRRHAARTRSSSARVSAESARPTRPPHSPLHNTLLSSSNSALLSSHTLVPRESAAHTPAPKHSLTRASNSPLHARVKDAADARRRRSESTQELLGKAATPSIATTTMRMVRMQQQQQQHNETTTSMRGRALVRPLQTSSIACPALTLDSIALPADAVNGVLLRMTAGVKEECECDDDEKNVSLSAAWPAPEQQQQQQQQQHRSAASVTSALAMVSERESEAEAKHGAHGCETPHVVPIIMGIAQAAAAAAAAEAEVEAEAVRTHVVLDASPPILARTARKDHSRASFGCGDVLHAHARSVSIRSCHDSQPYNNININGCIGVSQRADSRASMSPNQSHNNERLCSTHSPRLESARSSDSANIASPGDERGGHRCDDRRLAASHTTHEDGDTAFTVAVTRVSDNHRRASLTNTHSNNNNYNDYYDSNTNNNTDNHNNVNNTCANSHGMSDAHAARLSTIAASSPASEAIALTAHTHPNADNSATTSLCHAHMHTFSPAASAAAAVQTTSVPLPRRHVHHTHTHLPHSSASSPSLPPWAAPASNSCSSLCEESMGHREEETHMTWMTDTRAAADGAVCMYASRWTPPALLHRACLKDAGIKTAVVHETLCGTTSSSASSDTHYCSSRRVSRSRSRSHSHDNTNSNDNINSPRQHEGCAHPASLVQPDKDDGQDALAHTCNAVAMSCTDQVEAWAMQSTSPIAHTAAAAHTQANEDNEINAQDSAGDTESRQSRTSVTRAQSACSLEQIESEFQELTGYRRVLSRLSGENALRWRRVRVSLQQRRATLQLLLQTASLSERARQARVRELAELEQKLQPLESMDSVLLKAPHQLRELDARLQELHQLRAQQLRQIQRFKWGEQATRSDLVPYEAAAGVDDNGTTAPAKEANDERNEDHSTCNTNNTMNVPTTINISNDDTKTTTVNDIVSPVSSWLNENNNHHSGMSNPVSIRNHVNNTMNDCNNSSCMTRPSHSSTDPTQSYLGTSRIRNHGTNGNDAHMNRLTCTSSSSSTSSSTVRLGRDTHTDEPIQKANTRTALTHARTHGSSATEARIESRVANAAPPSLARCTALSNSCSHGSRYLSTRTTTTTTTTGGVLTNSNNNSASTVGVYTNKRAAATEARIASRVANAAPQEKKPTASQAFRRSVTAATSSAGRGMSSQRSRTMSATTAGTTTTTATVATATAVNRARFTRSKTLLTAQQQQLAGRRNRSLDDGV